VRDKLFTTKFFLPFCPSLQQVAVKKRVDVKTRRERRGFKKVEACNIQEGWPYSGQKF
jgi:hypothetical protein